MVDPTRVLGYREWKAVVSVEIGPMLQIYCVNELSRKKFPTITKCNKNSTFYAL